ncbi:MAG TPA: YciI family protein [Gammaproteobacteria bacterium]|nr:YciI family protein [Gammaproteobacteria bacterium]
MQYLLLIYAKEADYAAMDKKTSEAFSHEYDVFTQGIVKSGNFKGGERLRPTNTATTVRVKNGKAVNTDGPFVETREQLGGFYLIEAKDLDEATDIAARIPAAKHGCVEVRPIWPMNT